jgi:hypothetical protein
MTVVADASPLSQMLNKAFAKFDRDGNNKLTGDELNNFDQILRPGVALDDNGRPTVDMKQKLDHNGDGDVDLDEMNSTGILMPANMRHGLFLSSRISARQVRRSGGAASRGHSGTERQQGGVGAICRDLAEFQGCRRMGIGQPWSREMRRAPLAHPRGQSMTPWNIGKGRTVRAPFH